MVQAALLLLVLTNAAWRERVHRVDAIEFNAFCGGSKQVIVWDMRPGRPWPQDWATNPSGQWTGAVWLDDAGFAIQPREATWSATEFDPERRAYNWWRDRDQTLKQGGIFRK